VSAPAKRGRGKAPTSPSRVRHAERVAQALAMRIEGASTPQIAAALGISRSGAWRLLDGALAKLSAEIRDETEQLRAIQHARLERAVADVTPKAEAGDMSAYRVLVRLLEAEARLLGLNLEQPPAGEMVASIEILYSTPSQRGEVVDGEFTEVAPPALGSGEAADPDEGDDEAEDGDGGGGE
jgi:DNA-binding CsgD family transcriptional regulator